MPKFIVIADMGDQWDHNKFVTDENENFNAACCMGAEMAREVYQSFEGYHGVLTEEECEEEDMDYEDQIASEVDMIVEEVTSKTKTCPECKEVLSEYEVNKGMCFACSHCFSEDELK